MRVLTTEDAKKARFRRDKKQAEEAPPKPKTTKSELQAKALNSLVESVNKSIQMSDKTSFVIAQALSKIEMPKFPESWKEIEFRVTGRDKDKNLVTFTAKRIA
jgi:hypothetical protein